MATFFFEIGNLDARGRLVKGQSYVSLQSKLKLTNHTFNHFGKLFKLEFRDDTTNVYRCVFCIINQINNNNNNNMDL